MSKYCSASEGQYDPNLLLNALLSKLQLKNDAALARKLEIAPPILSKIRHGVLTVGPSVLVRINEVTGMRIRELQDLMGDRRSKYRYSKPRKLA